MKRLLVTVRGAVPSGNEQPLSENVVGQSRSAGEVIVADYPVNDVLRCASELSYWVSRGISLSACFDFRVLYG